MPPKGYRGLSLYHGGRLIRVSEKARPWYLLQVQQAYFFFLRFFVFFAAPFAAVFFTARFFFFFPVIGMSNDSSWYSRLYDSHAPKR